MGFLDKINYSMIVDCHNKRSAILTEINVFGETKMFVDGRTKLQSVRVLLSEEMTFSGELLFTFNKEKFRAVSI